MKAWKGTTSGSILSETFPIEAKIISYSLVNNSGGAATIQVAIVEAGTEVEINSVELEDGKAYLNDKPIVLQRGFEILITSSAEIDYYFSIE